MKLKYLVSLLIFISFASAEAQPFKWFSEIEKVEKKEFYKIQLRPEVVAKLKSDCSDIRIFDAADEEIPFLFYPKVAKLEYRQFKEYKIIVKEHNKPKGYTRLVIQNPSKNEITNFILHIKNSDVKKWLKLNASDDNKNWYVLKDNYYFESITETDGTSQIRVLNFPLSTYEYYELLISDYYDEPINIVNVGYWDLNTENGKYSTIANCSFSQTDSAKRKETIVKISLPEANYIDKINFKIEYPTFYLRKAEIAFRDSSVKKGNRVDYFYSPIKTLELSSNAENQVLLENYKAKEVYLIVSNFDDKPLIFKEVKVSQLNKYLVANLTPNNQMVLKFGNKDINAPVYDLQYFRDSIPKNLPVIKTKGVVSLLDDNANNEGSPNKSTAIIWLAMGAVMILLGFMTVKMLSEMKKKT